MDIANSEIFMRAVIGGLVSAVIGFIIYLIKIMRKSLSDQTQMSLHITELKLEVESIKAEQEKQSIRIDKIFVLLEDLVVLNLSTLYFAVNSKNSKTLDIHFKAMLEAVKESCQEVGLNGRTSALFDELKKINRNTRKKH